MNVQPEERSAMHSVIRAGDLEPTPGGTVRFEGEGYGSGVSFFLVNNEPGAGPDLHWHPYSETWIVRAGKGRFTADGQDFEAGPGDILVVGPETPHKFKNIGDGRLDIVCIHASPVMIQEELEETL
jgi:mannose-6-phosphate isomerase-like protein (cupin superfamily)